MNRIKLQGDIIGLDLGVSRTGVSRLNTIARLAEPLSVIDMKNGNILMKTEKLVSDYGACAVVVGIPRGLDGQTTKQTLWAIKLLEMLENGLKVPVFSIDEAGTTKKAETIVRRGQSIDSVAAGIILEDFAGEVLAGKIENVSI